MVTLNEIIAACGQKTDNVLAVYPYGSRVYGTDSSTSDYDFIVVVSSLLSNGVVVQSDQYSYNNLNINVYQKDHFQHLIDEHSISVLECVFLPASLVLLERHKFRYRFDESKLRSSISKKADNSWVKSKKKLIVEKDHNPYAAKKSLFHSLRILMFGLQIATKKRIVDYSEANELWHRISLDQSVDWEHYRAVYGLIYNDLKSRLRQAAKK
jgi:predicted nucleotidyltransferase